MHCTAVIDNNSPETLSCPIVSQIRALQRRVHEAEQRANASSGAAADEPDGGDASDEIYAEGEVHRLLAHSRRAAAEMEQYGKVCACVGGGQGGLHFVCYCICTMHDVRAPQHEMR